MPAPPPEVLEESPGGVLVGSAGSVASGSGSTEVHSERGVV